MSDVAYPRPENLRGRFGRWVTADVFNIANRIREVEGGDRLYIQHLDPPVTYIDGDIRHFAIIEYVPEGKPPEQLVTTVSALDSRVIEHMQYLRKVPFKIRFAEAERLEKKRADEDRERQLDEALENWGWDFRRQLAHDGFITTTGVSYPSRAIKPSTAPKLWQPAL
jgi:hypothetical protein